MEAGKKIGLIPSFHGDELNNLESGIIASKVGARAVSHLEYVIKCIKFSFRKIQLKKCHKNKLWV